MSKTFSSFIHKHLCPSISFAVKVAYNVDYRNDTYNATAHEESSTNDKYMIKFGDKGLIEENDVIVKIGYNKKQNVVKQSRQSQFKPKILNDTSSYVDILDISLEDILERVKNIGKIFTQAVLGFEENKNAR